MELQGKSNQNAKGIEKIKTSAKTCKVMLAPLNKLGNISNK